MITSALNIYSVVSFLALYSWERKCFFGQTKRVRKAISISQGAMNRLASSHQKITIYIATGHTQYAQNTRLSKWWRFPLRKRVPSFLPQAEGEWGGFATSIRVWGTIDERKRPLEFSSSLMDSGDWCVGVIKTACLLGRIYFFVNFLNLVPKRMPRL